ncbi:MAG TPA: hypothetical protein VKX35_11245 [Fermentimonas sp.]|jgi:hypothetical protein|nr:hypothetical protein [Fermentimonas sp.]
MSLTKVLVSVKTYPTLSEKYDELVCTAGFREDGSWIRIYPVPFRKLDYSNRYNKWEWIEMDLVKNTKDFRPESYRPADLTKEIKRGGKVSTENGWFDRKELCFKNKVYTNLTELIAEAKDKEISTSLAIVKPKEIIDFVWEPCDSEWDRRKLDTIKAMQLQGELFDLEDTKEIFNVVRKLPYKFSYIFTTEDDIQRKIMVEDWEIGQLYWNCLSQEKGDEAKALEKVKHKYFDTFLKRDLHFFMGTTREFHYVGKNPFIIIGVFYPPKVEAHQMKLF